MVFEAIETQVTSKFAEPLGDTKKLTVEYILTQKGWRGNTEDDWEECVKFIGNLALASKGLNSSISNKSWENKKKALNKHSRLYLNKELLENDLKVCDEMAIVKRGEQLAQVIVKIWLHADDI